MRTFRTRSPEVLLQVYKSVIRPTLEYACVIWNPTMVGQIRKLEKVQKWYTKRLADLAELSYDRRLQVLKLETLYSRRQYFDLQQVANVMFSTSRAQLFQLQSDNQYMGLRGHAYAIRKPRSNTSQRQHFFTCRVIDDWNGLPDRVISLIGQPCAFSAALQAYIFKYSFNP
jgi:hypothetical protein